MKAQPGAFFFPQYTGMGSHAIINSFIKQTALFSCEVVHKSLVVGSGDCLEMLETDYMILLLNCSEYLLSIFSLYCKLSRKRDDIYTTIRQKTIIFKEIHKY